MNENWAVSSYTTAAGNCVEARRVADGVRIRDTKNRQGGLVMARAQAWQAFASWTGGQTLVCGAYDCLETVTGTFTDRLAHVQAQHPEVSGVLWIEL